MTTEEEMLKKSLFLDSYMLSQNELFYRRNLSHESEMEKAKGRFLEENSITLKDVGFFPYDVGSTYFLWMGYRSIYKNIERDRSKYIVYPYGFKYKNKTENGVSEEKQQRKGGFFALNSNILPKEEVYQRLANLSNVQISKSKALYDIDIGIFTFETNLNGKPTNLFSEASQICTFFSLSLSKVSACAHDLSQLKELRNAKPNKGQILMITPSILNDNNFLFQNGENNFKLLIIPDHVIETEDLILKAWGASGIQKIKDFVNKGGNILATGKSGYILEKIGLIVSGSYKTGKFLYYLDLTKDSDNALVDLTGCEDIVTMTPEEQTDFIKQLMCMNTRKKIYLTSAYTMDKSKVEGENELSVIMSLKSNYINNNLVYKLTDGNDEQLGSDNYFPLVLSKQEGNKGALFIINGNLFPNTDNTYQLLLNPMFYAMGKNMIFDAYVKYSDGMEEDMPIPGGEEGVRLNCFFKFLNLIDSQVKDITVDIFIAQKTIFINEPEGCTKKINDKTKYNKNLTDMDLTSYMHCELSQLQKYSEFSKEIVIEVTDQSVTQKSTAIPLFYPFLEYTDSNSNEKIYVDYGAVTVTASLSAILRVTANPEPPGDYPLYAWGNFIDQVYNVENKENTVAKNITLISVIPVISPIVNDMEGNSVVRLNEFYDEYYKKHEYIYPFTKTGAHVDFVDYAELSGKDVVIVKDFEQPVKYVKVDRTDVTEDEVKNLFHVSGKVNDDINEEKTVKTNSQMLLKEICYEDADIFYELADFRRLIFLDTSSKEGAQAFYNNNIPEEDQDPADTSRAKIQIPFARVDFYFETDPNYQIPTNITNDMIFTTDKYPEPAIKTDEEIKKYRANISKIGNFNSSLHDGKIIPDEYYNVLKQHSQIKKYIDPLNPDYNITQDFPDITLSHYLIKIKGDRITRAGSIKGFIEENPGPKSQGYLEEYPHVKFIYAHSVSFLIHKNLTRLGGKLVINLGTNSFKNHKLPSENEFVTLSVDGVAVYKMEYDYEEGVKNIIYAYFKRGLMPDETSGKDTTFDLNIENLTATEDITATIELYDLKYDLSKKENHFEDFLKVESFISDQTLSYAKFWSLPCLVINNKFERNGSDTIKEYELIDPYQRYTLYYQELISHRTVFANSLSHHVHNPGLQTPYSSYGLISNIGIVSIPFADYVSHPALIIPAATSTSRIEWDDVWGRRWAQPIRSLFPDFLPLPYVAQSFMMSTTYEIIQNGNRVLEWGSADPGYILVHMKFINNYFKYVNLAICKENAQIQGANSYDNVTIEHSNVYGKCYQDTRAFLSGRKIDETIINSMTDAMLCGESDNADDMVECAERIKALTLPLLEMKPNNDPLPEGYRWNYSPLVDSYYPKGYLDEEIMWEMTKPNYASDVYFKGYPWVYDNNLPSFDSLYSKPDNLMAFPIFKGFGYKMEYSANNSVKNRYLNKKGWWTDNLQNKDNTLLAGQPYVNINPTINKTILTDDYWVNGKKMTQKMKDRLKNIYVCQFNQHRIKVDPNNLSQLVTFHNIFQNNIIPIYPDIKDEDYINYDCSDFYQYTSENITQVDNRVKTNNDRDWLYFALNLRAEGKETLNIILTLDPFSDRKYEGETKVNDGGRFTYWNPALTKNGYIYLDNNVNVVNSFRVDLEADVSIFPLEVNTFKAVNYHLFSLGDPNEELREYKQTVYTNSYGYGDSTVMINVGGPQNTDCRIKPGETTFVKITFFNNAGFDWHLKAGAITSDEITIKPNTLMKDNNVIAIRSPKEYNFLELEIPESIKDYVEIVPSDHNKDVKPQFFDFECINSVTIRDGFKAEYYYKLTLKPGLDEKYFGRFWEIKVNIKYEYFDILPGFDNDPATKVKYDITFKHDYTLKVPPIRFGIPYSSTYKVPEYRNKVFYTIGRATNISISYNIHEEFSLDDIKILSKEEVETLRSATSDSANVNEKLLDFWNNGISNTSSYLTGEIKAKKLEPDNSYKRIWIYLNQSFPEFPYEIYGEPDRTKIYILVKVSAPQVTYGTKLVLKWGYGEYNDSRVIRKTNTGLANYVSSSGPWINVDIEYTVIKYDKENNNFTEAEDQKHYPIKGYLKLKLTALNGGNKDAYQTSYKYVFSKYVKILKNYGDVLNKKEIMSLSNNASSGETILSINSNRQIPQNTKDAYNIYIYYDFEEIGAFDSIIIQRNLAEDTDKVLVKSADVSLCQNTKCNNEDSLVNQYIDINYKLSMNNIVEGDNVDLLPELEIKPELEIENTKSKPNSESKAWIIAVIIAFLIVLALCIYLFIDYKKKLCIFKRSEIVPIEPENEKQGIEDITEKIEVKRKRRSIKNNKSYISVDMKTNTKI